MWSVCECVHMNEDAQRPESLEFCETDVSGSCEPLDAVQGLKLESSGRAVPALNFWAISSAVWFFCLFLIHYNT